MNTNIEITPKTNIEGLKDSKSDIFITWLPNDEKETILNKVIEVFEMGLTPVPHIPAKKIKDVSEAFEIADDIANYTNKVLIIGGGGKVEGSFNTVDELVETGAFDGFKIGVGGFPEGNGPLSVEDGIEILNKKKEYADFVVTQWSLDSDAILKFMDKSPLPVHVGVPVKTKMPALLKFAKACGMESSTKAFLSNKRNMLKFMFGFDPNHIINKVKGHSNLASVHYYTFGNVKNI